MSDWEEEFDAEEVVVSTRPKMAWDDEESDGNESVKEDWDDSEEEEVPAQKVEKKAEPVKAPAKKMTLKQKIAEKEALLKEQKAKKIALANRFIDGETEEERFERAQKEAGIKKAEFDEFAEGDAEAPAKKAPSKPVESIKNPRTQAQFEELKQLLIDLILQQKNNPNYTSFVEQFAKDLAQPMKDMDIRKAASSLTALANDKQRQQKEALKSSKKTKGKVQAAPKPAAPVNTREYSSTYDDFDDFM